VNSKKKSISDPILHRWVDGEVEDPHGEIAKYVEEDPRAQAEIRAVRTTGEFLRSSVKDVAFDVEPLQAVHAIQERLLKEKNRQPLEERQSLFRKRKTWAWMGLVAAFVLGILVAPWFGSWVSQWSSDGSETVQPKTASVVVETVEVEDNRGAMVIQPEDGNTAVIWVETNP